MGATPSGTLSLNEVGPFHFGDHLTFTWSASKLGGAHPMIEVCLFQDLDGDGLQVDLFGKDLTYVALDAPDKTFIAGFVGEGTSVDGSKPALGRARLLAYGWKGRQEYIIPLADPVEFSVS